MLQTYKIHYGTIYDSIIICDFRHLVTSAPDEVHPRNSFAAYVEFVDAAQRIRAAFREHTEKEIKEFKFFNQEAEARKRVAAIKIQHAFHNYNKARKMTEAATRIQRTFRARKSNKNQHVTKSVCSHKSQRMIHDCT